MTLLLTDMLTNSDSSFSYFVSGPFVLVLGRTSSPAIARTALSQSQRRITSRLAALFIFLSFFFLKKKKKKEKESARQARGPRSLKNSPSFYPTEFSFSQSAGNLAKFVMYSVVGS